MSVFVIADTHLSISTENKSMEVFGGRWNDYISKLEKNWNECVKDSDSIVVAGDISWGIDMKLCFEDFEFLNNKLNGVKYILKGNHDYWWTTMVKMNNWLNSNGFDKIKIVHNNAYLCENYIICGTRGWFIDETEEEEPEHPGGESPNSFNLKILNREVARLEASARAAEKLLSENQDREIIAFLHYPPLYGDYICPEIIEVLEKENIKRCYFGHIHNAAENRIIKKYGNVNFALVSADYLKFKPLKI